MSSIRLHASAQNEGLFSGDTFESVLGTAARILVQEGHQICASILASGSLSVKHWEHDNWNGGQDTWRLGIGISPDSYFELKDREGIQKEIEKAISLPMRAVSESNFIDVELVTALDPNPDWRERTQQHLMGQGINNQGRVRSDNIAFIEHKGLRFRSYAEKHFHLAMGSTGLPFAPLPVVVIGGTQPRRIEPDFIIWSRGVTLLVEIDGDNFHTEKPADAHARLKCLLDEGVHLERIKDTECNTEPKAREAVARILQKIEKLKAAQ